MFTNIWEYALIWILIMAPFVFAGLIVAYLFYYRMAKYFTHIEKNFDQFLIYFREVKELMRKKRS